MSRARDNANLGTQAGSGLDASDITSGALGASVTGGAGLGVSTAATSTFAPKASPTFTGSFTFTPTSSIPASPTEGMMYYESDEDTIMVYGGTSDGSAVWFPLSRKITGGHITTYTDTNNYRSHSFLGSGTFYTPVALTVDVLLVGGGGGGGAYGGGGGAGEFRTTTGLSVNGAYSVQCGEGGMASTSYGTNGQHGGITIFSNYRAMPGGGGGSYNGGAGSPGGFSENTSAWNTKGSGGGGGTSASGATTGAGAGGQGGNNGGTGQGNNNPLSIPNIGGGGGGAGAVGVTGNGGVGSPNTYRDGTNIYYAGGGAGYAGGAGTGNAYGGGGAGHGDYNNASAGNGKTGCVIIRYQI